MSYIKLVKAVYRQRMYLYLVQFSGMLHCWLQRYYTRIELYDSPLYMLKEPFVCCVSGILSNIILGHP